MSVEIIDKPFANEYLQKLDLDIENLITVIRYAESEKALCTANDPVGFGSFTAYARAGRKLREIYTKNNWEKDDSHNQCAIRHPKKNIRLVPCNFNEAAGDKLSFPTNKSPKGEISRKKSLCNYSSTLPGFPVAEPEEDENGDLTWVLGFFMGDDLPLTAELCLPIDFKGGYYTHFSTRVILLDGGEDYGKTKSYENPDDAFEVIDIDIKRK